MSRFDCVRDLTQRCSCGHRLKMQARVEIVYTLLWRTEQFKVNFILVFPGYLSNSSCLFWLFGIRFPIRLPTLSSSWANEAFYLIYLFRPGQAHMTLHVTDISLCPVSCLDMTELIWPNSEPFSAIFQQLAKLQSNSLN